MSAPRTRKNPALVQRYMAEVNRRPCLNRAEETALARRLRQGDSRAAEALVVANLRFVVKIAHGYAGYGCNLLDLVQEGNVGLIEAVRRFDPERGYRLVSYAVWWIRAHIHNFVIRGYSLVKLGTTNEQRKLFFKLRAERERALRLGHDASAPALAARLGVTAEVVSEMASRMDGRDLSLDVPVDSESPRSHLDLLPGGEETLDDKVAARERDLQVRAAVDATRDRLSTKERLVVDLRLMADEPETLEEIGLRLAVSRERVRQIESKVLRLLERALRACGLSAAA